VDGQPVATGRTVEDTQDLLDTAWRYVEALAFEKTDRRFCGKCKEWIRPCPPCDCTFGDCRCGAHYRPIDLSQHFDQPILGVSGMEINGVAIPVTQPGDWPEGTPWYPPIRVDECRWIVWQHIAGCPPDWPQQDLARPVGANCTWQICIEYGAVPPITVTKAVADMVSEQIKACIDPDSCALPDNVESVTERGRTYKFRAPSDTNSGVDSWDRMCELFPVSATGSEGLILPAKAGGVRIIGSSDGLVSPR